MNQKGSVCFDNDDGSPVVVLQVTSMGESIGLKPPRQLGYFLDDWRYRCEISHVDGLARLVDEANAKDGGKRVAAVSFRRPRFIIRRMGHGAVFQLEGQTRRDMNLKPITDYATGWASVSTDETGWDRPAIVMWPFPSEEKEEKDD